LFTGDCPTTTTVGETPEPVLSPRLSSLGLRPARSEARFRIELHARSPVSFAIYDVRGRRLRTLVDGDLPAGATDVVWDGRDQNGATAAAGVYFGSLQTSGTRFVARVPFFR
jgi:FlgD Ig-like domain